MGEEKLNFLLMGKTGQGKSATGNTILNRRVFKTASNTMSETKDVDFSFTNFGKYILMVVDGPGLEDTAMDKAKDKELAAKHMSQALAMCYGGIDAFLLVIRFGIRFTEEEISALNSLKRIFGDSYLNHVIVVVTAGDLYQGAMEEEQLNISFDDWCKKQIGEFRQLYQDCKGRFVLFNNREKDEKMKQAQIQQIVQLAQGLKNDHGRYTAKCFKDAEAKREKLILELKAPQLSLEIQEKISLLNSDIETFTKEPSDSNKQKVLEGIKDLKVEIEIKDKGYGVLNDMKKLAENIERNMDDEIELQRLTKELEGTRTAKTIWSVLGSVVTLAGGVMCLAAPVVGAAVAIGSTVVTGLGRLALGSDEKKIEQQHNEIQNKKKA